MQIGKNERRCCGFDRAKQLHDCLVFAANREAQADPSIRASIFRRSPFAAADLHAGRCRQLFEMAMEARRGDRVAGAVQRDFPGARGSVRLSERCAQRRQLFRGDAEPREQALPVRERRVPLRIQVKDRRDDDQVRNDEQKAEDRYGEQPPGSPGRQVRERNYGPTSAVIVNTSERVASIRVTGAAKVGFRK